MRVSEQVEHWARKPKAEEVIEVPLVMALDHATRFEALAQMFAAGHCTRWRGRG